MGNPTTLNPNLNSILSRLPQYSEADVTAQEAEEKKRRQAMRVKDLLDASGMSRRHLRQLQAGFINAHDLWQREITKIRGLLGKGIIAVMLGKRGTGKTLAATALVEEACRACRRAAYTSAPLFYLDLRDSYRDGATTTEKEVLKKHVGPDLLVIDEVHERGDTPWSDRMLTFLIDQRYQDLKDTILIANQTVEDFTSSVGPSIVDRAREGGGILMYDWKSFRGAA